METVLEGGSIIRPQGSHEDLSSTTKSKSLVILNFVHEVLAILASFSVARRNHFSTENDNDKNRIIGNGFGSGSLIPHIPPQGSHDDLSSTKKSKRLGFLNFVHDVLAFSANFSFARRNHFSTENDNDKNSLPVLHKLI